MKQQLSSVDLHYVITELQECVGFRVDKVFQPEKKYLLVQLHSSEKGKRYIHLGKKFLYQTQYKDTQEVTSRLPPFCKTLRNVISNATITDIKQHKFERIAVFTLQKEETFYLIAEFFDKGNVILCDNTFQIKNVLERQLWKNRSILPNEPYQFVEKEYSPLADTEEEFMRLLKETQKESVVLFFAIELGFGGVYAEEICSDAGIDKRLAPQQINATEGQKLYQTMQGIFTRSIEPTVYLNPKEEEQIARHQFESLSDLFGIAERQLQDLKKDPQQADEEPLPVSSLIKDITPFPLSSLETSPSVQGHPTFSETLDEAFRFVYKHQNIYSALHEKQQNLDQLRRIRDSQNRTIEQYEAEFQKAQQKGTLLYENYGVVSKIMKECSKHPLSKIKEQLDQVKTIYPQIVSVSPKDHSITLDL